MTGDPGIRPHRKQYIVGPEPCPVEDDWRLIPLEGGLWLSHCRDLRVAATAGADGEEWHLLGLASQTRSERPDPLQDLATATAETVVSHYEDWVGRWVLIGGSEIHLDATGQLPCHWVQDDGGRTWASSSPAAIRARTKGRPERRHDLVYERAMSWVAPPLGCFVGARRLLPCQILDVGSGTTRWRRLAVPPHELELEPTSVTGSGSLPAVAAVPPHRDRAMAAFVDALGHGMARLPPGERLQIGLTAGADSRLILAAALASGVPIDVFTRRSARMSVADRVIPPRLAAAVGLSHREVVPNRASAARFEMAMTHTDGQVSPGDALPFVQAVRDRFSGIEIGGQGLGAGKVKNRNFPAVIGDVTTTADLIADHFGEPAHSPNRQALRCWLRLVKEHEADQHPEDRIDWRDRIYLEQRTAGWQAAKEQLYDLHSHQRFFPVNSTRVIGLLLAIDPELRRDGSHRKALIELADDRLVGEPFNPPGHRFGPARRLAHLLTVDPGGAVARVARRLEREADT